MNAPSSYKPSAFYFRKALRENGDPEELREIGFHLVTELEQLKQWVRDRGLVPPKWNVMQTEIDEKNWGSVVPLPTGAQYAQALKSASERGSKCAQSFAPAAKPAS